MQFNKIKRIFPFLTPCVFVFHFMKFQEHFSLSKGYLFMKRIPLGEVDKIPLPVVGNIAAVSDEADGGAILLDKRPQRYPRQHFFLEKF